MTRVLVTSGTGTLGRVLVARLRDLAARLADLAVGPPLGRVPDFGGPAVHSATALTRMSLRATGKRRTLVPVRPPGKVFRAFRAGANLTPAHADGRITFEEYLAAH